MLILDSIAREIAVNIGDSNAEKLPEISRHIQTIVSEITSLLRKGAVYRTASLTLDSNRTVTLPEDCIGILKIYNSSVFYEPVDNDIYRLRSMTGSSLNTARVFEDVPYWRIEFLNGTVGGTVSVDYLVHSANPALIPSYYKQLLIAGATRLYHLNKLQLDAAKEFERLYKQEKDKLVLSQAVNDNRFVRMKSLDELELLYPNYGFMSNNDYIGGP